MNDFNYATNAPIEISAWTNEEGSRFAPAMIGSGVFGGEFTLEEGLACKDRDGNTLGDELKRIGYAGDMKCAPRELGAFFEAHIEQGPILEAEEKTIGVVQGVQGIRWFEVEVTGMESHAGTTPMERRKDALVGVARMVSEAHRIGEAAMPDGRTTIGFLEVSPNSTNVIPGKVFFRADIRHPNASLLDGMESEYQAACEKIAADLDLNLDFNRIWYSEPVIFDEACVAAVQDAADTLGLDIADISLVEGDTDRVPFGIGTWGSRSLSTAGMAVAVAADKVIKKAKLIAAHKLECAAEDIEVIDSKFLVKGTDRSLTFAQVADAAYHSGDRPEGLEIGLEETHFYDPTDCNYPSAIHVCVVLVDAETGRVTLRNYWAVDDVGTLVNPMVVEGQIHGGLVQGIGQALMEDCTYDPDSGQYISGTFMDYAIPRAADIPSLGVDTVVTYAPSNPLGIKGAGESGTIGAPACISNGVIDALWHLGVRQVTQPMTPNKIWRAISTAKA